MLALLVHRPGSEIDKDRSGGSDGVRPQDTRSGSSSNAITQFSWRQVETADYEQYVKNLRGIGCPEPTVEDIVVADVNALFMEKAAPVLRDSTNSLAELYNDPHWRNPDSNSQQRSAIVASAKVKLATLNTQRLAVISRLLGHEVAAFKTANEPWGYAVTALASNEFPFLSPDKSARVVALLKRASEDIRTKIPPGRALSVADARYADEINQAADREIAKVLTPSEYAEYLLQHSAEGQELSRKLNGIPVTDRSKCTISGAKQRMPLAS